METRGLPKHGDLSSEQTSFLDQLFGASEDLLLGNPSRVLSDLRRQCSDLETDFLGLQTRLSKSCVSWISHSFATKSDIRSLSLSLQNLSLVTSQHGIGSKRFHGVLGRELPKLAEKVMRIEEIRSYVETTLRLEAMVGDLEDAVLCFMNCRTGSMFSANISNSLISKDSGIKHEKLLQAIKSMNDVEEVLIDLVGNEPHWQRLIKSVDARVDKNLAILRPQVSADHRALLNSLGWPPKLSTSRTENGPISDLPNPLLIMQGEKKKSYSNGFIALCALQHLQTRREARMLNLLGQSKFNVRLWAIDELVSPIASRMEYHFLKWVDQPEFMFALVHRITRNFVAEIDDVLQPLIDRARLVSCSAKEAWVCAMVQTLSRFLETRVFTPLADKYKDKQTRSEEIISSWLHLIDLILPFDKQMQSLLGLETGHFLEETESREGLSRGFSLLQIFCDRPEWLKIWAKMEVKNACKKLKMELQDERCWRVGDECQAGLHLELESELYVLSTREDHKAPPIAESAVKIAWRMIERCQTMPVVLPRIRFIRSTAAKFLWYFFKVMLLRYKGTEIFPEDLNDYILNRVSSVINAARYIEFRLQQWSDNVDFLELKVAEKEFSRGRVDETVDGILFFKEEIKSLSELETNWLVDIIAVILRQFETLSWDYVKQTKDLKGEREVYVQVSVGMNLAISIDFIEALETLRTHLLTLKASLNPKDFLDLWRSVAEGLDHFIYFSDIFSEVRFCNNRINQLETDMQALFLVFKPFCVRPEAFFPNIKEGLKLLIVNKKKRDIISSMEKD